MDQKGFGKLLKKYRNQTRDPANGQKLRQGDLGELLETMGGLPGFSATQISYWENAKRQPPERPIVIGMIEMLAKYGGIDTIEEANALLKAVDYVGLDSAEIAQFNLLTERQMEPMVSENDHQRGLISVTGNVHITNNHNHVLTKANLSHETIMADEDRMLFLGRVEKFIEPIVPHLLHDMPTIPLQYELLPAMVNRPLREKGTAFASKLPPEGTINEVVDQLSSAVLLGAAGSGKTLIALRLLQRAYRAARQDPQAPLPIFLFLSDWRAETDIESLIREQVERIYQLPFEMVATSINRGRAYFILDGLDEVAAE